MDEFKRIAAAFTYIHGDVAHGKMMSSPGLKCNNRVFAFEMKDGMGFRLGPDFDPDAAGLQSARPLSPFKTKPPLKGWYIVGEAEQSRWEELAGQALAFTRTLKR